MLVIGQDTERTCVLFLALIELLSISPSSIKQTFAPRVATTASSQYTKLGFAAATAASAAFFASQQSTACDEALPVYGVAGTNQERTFLAVKPDGVQRGLIGDIIARFEKRG